MKLNVGIALLLPGKTLVVTEELIGIKPESMALALSLMQGSLNDDCVTVWLLEALNVWGNVRIRKRSTNVV